VLALAVRRALPRQGAERSGRSQGVGGRVDEDDSRAEEAASVTGHAAPYFDPSSH
jgi:hypothetical protein